MKEKSFKVQKLSNGVRLVIIPMSGVKSVATSVMVGVGSRYENQEISGISHFLEHMVFKGTKNYPSTDDVNIVEKNGGLQNAYTDVDVTNFHNKVLSSDWHLGLSVNTDLALMPMLEQKYVDLERNVIIEEMKRYEDDPGSKAEEVFHALMYPNSCLGRKIIGTEKSLANIKADTLQKYHDMWYTPEQIVVVIAGQIEDEKKLVDFVNDNYNSLKSTNPPKIEKVNSEILSGKKASVIVRKELMQASFEFGVHTFNRNSTDRFAWSVFNILMGVSFTSRLFREIREKKGLCYHIRSSNSNWEETGYWSIIAGVAAEKVTESLSSIKEEITKVVQSGVKQDEVNISKKRIKTMLAMKSEDPEFLNEFYGRQVLFGGELLDLDEYTNRIEKVEIDEINSLLHKYLDLDKFRLSVVTNRALPNMEI